ncbi:MAG: response regulator transcription factor [Chloroflexi bacterium]|nr:response regulator transcription factor [Chloroflexota bacterium]
MHRVLLVEDTLQLATTIVTELTQAHFQVVHAADGQTALALFGEQAFDLIVLDWMLPDMDGLDVLRQMRQASATPILMLTARSDETDRVVGLEVGADDYLTKPFNMRELIARLRAMLRRVDLITQLVQQDRQEKTVQRLQHGGIVLDEEAMQVEVEGSPVDLSPTEFALLRLLLRYPGRAFSRKYLMDVIWESQYEQTDRAVDYMVMRLRKKLGEAGDAIETVWGMGYRMKAEG